MNADTDTPPPQLNREGSSQGFTPTRPLGGLAHRGGVDSGPPDSGLGISLNRTASAARAINYSDRFIPSRTASNLSYAHVHASTASSENPQSTDREDATATYTMVLRSELLGNRPNLRVSTKVKGGNVVDIESPTFASPSSPARKMLRYKSGGIDSSFAGEPPPSPFAYSPIGTDAPFNAFANSPRKNPRKIPRSPFKVLDAPCLQDDFYLNLVDWSSQNVLAVGLGSSVYLWSACTSKVTKLCDLGSGDEVCSVAWTQRGTYLAVGTFRDAEVQIWDAVKCCMLRSMPGHRSRIGTLAWNGQTVSSGSRDKTILQRDLRASDPYFAKLTGHRSEVCGLKWSYDGRELASGGNDNQLLIWSLHSNHPAVRFTEHIAAVKAIAWSPHMHGLLASGGGTADRCIRFWNTTTSTSLGSMDTGSQVCNLVWSKNVNELVSTHGYSQNQIIVWRYPSMSKLSTLTGHTMRVLYLAISPDGQTIVTGAGDETLRFWTCFPGPKSQGAGTDSSVSSLLRTSIR
mmetsp:Transcript_16931/g.47251  ORF Transcript_16931/g.47251 Transcript_16931/m.47251 type:complete len:516 (-) Transcript_16931:487-2034(-)